MGASCKRLCGYMDCSRPTISRQRYAAFCPGDFRISRIASWWDAQTRRDVYLPGAGANTNSLSGGIRSALDSDVVRREFRATARDRFSEPSRALRPLLALETLGVQITAPQQSRLANCDSRCMGYLFCCTHSAAYLLLPRALSKICMQRRGSYECSDQTAPCVG